MPPPTFCDWVNSVDAVVVGTIETASALASPVWVFDGDPHIADSCDGDWVNYGLSLKVDVTSTLWGEPPAVIDVRVAAAAVDQWAYHPNEVDGELEWINAPSGLLEEGTTVGLALTRVPDTDVWALMGEMPFTFAADGSAIYADAECEWPAPTSRPADFETLESEVAACPQSPNSRRSLRVAQFTQRPDYSHAAACHYLD